MAAFRDEAVLESSICLQLRVLYKRASLKPGLPAVQDLSLQRSDVDSRVIETLQIVIARARKSIRAYDARKICLSSSYSHQRWKPEIVRHAN